MNARQRRIAVRAWRRRMELHAFSRPVGTVSLTAGELSALLDYSLTLPTLIKPGKQWRSNIVEVAHYARRRAPGGKTSQIIESLLWWTLLRPPRWLRALWYRATVLEETDDAGRHFIRWERIHVRPRTADELRAGRRLFGQFKADVTAALSR